VVIVQENVRFRLTAITRANSFPQAAEFRAKPRNLPFVAEFYQFRGISRNLRNDRWQQLALSFVKTLRLFSRNN